MFINAALHQRNDVAVSPEIQCSGSIYTDQHGYALMGSLYRQAAARPGETVRLNWQGLEHCDANLSALLLAVIRKAAADYDVQIVLDHAALGGRHNVFARNGLQTAVHGTSAVTDPRQSTIPVRVFAVEDADAFVQYIEQDFFGHYRLQGLPLAVREQMKGHFCELFCNVDIHAGTQEVCVSGQFFPQKRMLKFTMADTGHGFLKAIVAHTHHTEQPILTAPEAIRWALTGGSTKTQAPGGSGLRGILRRCLTDGHSLHIATDGCYWIGDATQPVKSVFHPISTPVLGSVVSLIFKNL